MPNLLKKYVSIPVISFFGRRKAVKILSDVSLIIGGCGRSCTSLPLFVLAAHPGTLAVAKQTGAFTRGGPPK